MDGMQEWENLEELWENLERVKSARFWIHYRGLMALRGKPCRSELQYYNLEMANNLRGQCGEKLNPP